jgi:integrase/recombinase XerC
VELGEREWIDRFLSHLALERRVSAHTVTAYRRDLLSLAEFGGRRRLAAWNGFDNSQLRTFAAALHGAGLSPRSIQRHLSAART